MAILIKNPETERKARELAGLKGQSITSAIDAALDRELALAKPVRPKPTVAEMIAATDRFREATGLDKVKLNITKADFDDLWAESEGLTRDRS